MNTNLDTLLIALYVLVDDHVVPPHQRRPGRPKKLTDAELVCLAAAQVLLGARSERRWLRMCRHRLGHLFPYLPQQPGYHKRLKAAAPLICRTILYLATLCPSWGDQLRLMDATPIPCGTSRPTVQRSALAEIAGYGYCAAHSRWYWGLKLYVITTREGMPTAWCLANPKLGEREVAWELFGHARDLGALPDGMIVLADKGLSGKDLERSCAEQLRLLLVHPDRKDSQQRRYGSLGGMRQWIESIIDTGKRPARPRRPRRAYRRRPTSGDDPRFNLGLALQVAAVLADHGYPLVEAGADLLRLQQALFTVIYQPKETQ